MRKRKTASWTVEIELVFAMNQSNAAPVSGISELILDTESDISHFF